MNLDMFYVFLYIFYMYIYNIYLYSSIYIIPQLYIGICVRTYFLNTSYDFIYSISFIYFDEF